MSHIEVYSLTTYHILLVKFGEHRMELYDLKLTIDFE